MTRQPAVPSTRTSSLRLRVGLGVLALLLVVLVGLGATVNAVLGTRLRSDLDQRLRDRAGLAQALGERNPQLSDSELASRLTGQGVLAVVNQSTGAENPQQQPPGGGPRPGGPGRPSAATNIKVERDGEVLSTRLTVEQRRIVLTANLSDIDRAVSTLRTVELAAGAATLVVVGLGLIWVVGAALSPLDRMTRLARGIRDGARGRRLRPTNERTEIGRTAVAFDDMLDALETAEQHSREAEERMRQFLADASHDLRTPVAGIITSAERLLREDPERATREAQLLTLIREGRRAARLVDDVVLMSRLDGQTDTPSRRRPVDLSALVAGVAQRRDELGGTVVVTAPAAVVVTGDADHLERLVTNLVDNAVRHAGVCASVDVEVHGDGRLAHLEVSDHGPGVAPADRQRIFDRFVRLVDHRGGPGSGLGLPIARAIAVSHGGRLDCLDRADGRPGARFVALLPLMTQVDVSTDQDRTPSLSASTSSDSSRRMSPA